MGDAALNLTGLSLIVPVYNEEKVIERTLFHLAQALSEICPDHEIIVCNDGSTDGSAELVRRLSQSNGRIRLVGYDGNRGYGYALRYGFAHATKSLVAYTDGDLPCDLSILGRCLELLRSADAVFAFRDCRDNALREFYSVVYNFLIRTVFSIKIRDVNFSFKIFKKEVLDSLALKAKGSFIDAEMVCKARKSGYRIEEVAAKYLLRTVGKSKLSSPGIILFIIYEMLKLYPEIIRTRKIAS